MLASFHQYAAAGGARAQGLHNYPKTQGLTAICFLAPVLCGPCSLGALCAAPGAVLVSQ